MWNPWQCSGCRQHTCSSSTVHLYTSRCFARARPLRLPPSSLPPSFHTESCARWCYSNRHNTCPQVTPVQEQDLIYKGKKFIKNWWALSAARGRQAAALILYLRQPRWAAAFCICWRTRGLCPGPSINYGCCQPLGLTGTEMHCHSAVWLIESLRSEKTAEITWFNQAAKEWPWIKRSVFSKHSMVKKGEPFQLSLNLWW